MFEITNRCSALDTEARAESREQVGREARCAPAGQARWSSLRRRSRRPVSLGQLQAAVDQIGDDDSAGDLGRQNDQGKEILLALNQRLGHTVDRVAAGNAARHLGNDEGAHVEFGVLLAVTDQRAGDLFGSHQADVGDEVAMDGVGQIDIEDDAGEVGAVVEEEVEVADVAAVVEDGDEALVLCRRAVDLKAVDGAVVGGAYQFGPLAFGGSPCRLSGARSSRCCLR